MWGDGRPRPSELIRTATLLPARPSKPTTKDKSSPRVTFQPLPRSQEPHPSPAAQREHSQSSKPQAPARTHDNARPNKTEHIQAPIQSAFQRRRSTPPAPQKFS